MNLGVALLDPTKPEPAQASEALEKALRLFRESSYAWGESLALITLGRFALATGRSQKALERFEESLALTRDRRDEVGETIAIHHVAWAHLVLGENQIAAVEFLDALEKSAALMHVEGVAYGLEGMVAIAATNGAVERAGRMLGAAETLRAQSGLRNSAAQAMYQPIIDAIAAGQFAEEFERGRIAGRVLPLDAAVAFAIESTGAGGVGGSTLTKAPD